MEYKDTDDDWVRVCNDEDFQIWKEDFEETKGMKLMIMADLNVVSATKNTE